MKKYRLVTTVLGMVAVMAVAFSIQAASPSMTVTSPTVNKAAVESYWTPARIASAPALPMPVDKGSPTEIDTLGLADAEHADAADSEPYGMPEPGADRLAQSVYKQAWKALYDLQAQEEVLGEEQPADVTAGTSATYTTFDVNTNANFWTVYPHKWVGKLVFTTSSGTASCSATAISNNHIVTAAHCVYDTTANKWYSNWSFVPAYRNGNAPYGTFSAVNATILTAWVNLSGSYSINTWARYDVAVIHMNKNSAGKTLNQMVGWAGRMWNFGYNQLSFNSGYPAKDYNNSYYIPSPAQYLRACINESFIQTTDTLGGGCNWGPGISGGSWLVGYKPFVASGSVNSVNSGLYVGSQNMYGARFNSNNIVPLCTAQGC